MIKLKEIINAALDQKLLCSKISSPGAGASALGLVNLVVACAHHSLNLGRREFKSIAQ